MVLLLQPTADIAMVLNNQVSSYWKTTAISYLNNAHNLSAMYYKVLYTQVNYMEQMKLLFSHFSINKIICNITSTIIGNVFKNN